MEAQIQVITVEAERKDARNIWKADYQVLVAGGIWEIKEKNE